TLPSVAIQMRTLTVNFLACSFGSADKRSLTASLSLPVYHAKAAPPVPTRSVPPGRATKPNESEPAAPLASSPSCCCGGAGVLSGVGSGCFCSSARSTFSGGGGGGGSGGGGGGRTRVICCTTLRGGVCLPVMNPWIFHISAPTSSATTSTPPA